MKLTISSKNEYYFYPNVGDNLKKEEKDRFTIVVKKVNPALVGSNWFIYNDKNEYVGINNAVKLRSHVKEIKNAPILLIDGEEREMTIDDLFSNDYTELYQIVLDLNQFISKLDTNGELETKKY